MFSCVTLWRSHIHLHYILKLQYRNSSLGHSLALYLRCPFRSFFDFIFAPSSFSLPFVFLSRTFFCVCSFCFEDSKKIANSLVKFFTAILSCLFWKEREKKQRTISLFLTAWEVFDANLFLFLLFGCRILSWYTNWMHKNGINFVHLLPLTAFVQPCDHFTWNSSTRFNKCDTWAIQRWRWLQSNYACRSWTPSCVPTTVTLHNCCWWPFQKKKKVEKTFENKAKCVISDILL